MSSIIIVPDKRSNKHANLLLQLISELHADKYEAAIWNEKEFKSSTSKIPSSSPIVFVGLSDSAEENMAQMKSIYNQFGMHIISLGQRVILYVETKKLNEKEYYEFKEYCSSIGVLVKKPSEVRKNNLSSKRMWLDPKNSLPDNLRTKLIDSGIIEDQRYQCLVSVFAKIYIDKILN